MPLEKFVYLHDNTTLACEAIAEPPANFTWFRNKKPIEERGIRPTMEAIDEMENIQIINEVYNHRSLLHIKMANGAAFGPYTCQVSNRLGSIERTIELKRGQRPRPPILVKLRGYNSHTFDVAIIHARANVTRPPSGTTSGHHQHHNQHDSKVTPDQSTEVKGFRIEYIREIDFKRDLGSWTKAQHKDFGNNEGLYFVFISIFFFAFSVFAVILMIGFSLSYM